MGILLIDIIEPLLWIIVGAMLTFPLNKFLENFFERRNKKKLIKRLKLKSLEFKKYNDVFPLEHGDPYFSVEDINIEDSQKSLVIEIPDEFKEQLLNLDKKFEFRPGISFNKSYTYEDLEKLTGITDLTQRIRNHSSIVAQDFLEMKKIGRVLFNGKMFGIYNLGGRIRETVREKTKLNIKTYNTDFFTYSVFGSIYQELKKEGHPISKVRKMEDLTPYTPFLTSLGICAFILLHENTEVVIAKRSRYITHNENKFHYSVNEAFSQTDLDEEGRPSLIKCVRRGLREELNIKEERFDYDVKFLDLVFSKEKFEVGITSIVSIPNLSFEDLDFIYRSAKDGELETDEIINLSLTKAEVKYFLKNYEMTEGSKVGLQLLLGRIDGFI